MTGYVVDASVAVKWLVTESFSDQAARLLDKALMLIAPELLFAEAANALWVMCRRGDITKADFAEAVAALKTAPVAVPVPMRQLAAMSARTAAKKLAGKEAVFTWRGNAWRCGGHYGGAAAEVLPRVRTVLNNYGPKE